MVDFLDGISFVMCVLKSQRKVTRLLYVQNCGTLKYGVPYVPLTNDDAKS